MIHCMHLVLLLLAVMVMFMIGLVSLAYVFLKAILQTQNAYLEAVYAQHRTLGKTVQETAGAIGAAVSQSLVPPVTAADQQEERLRAVVHDIAERFAPADDVDDSDPTDFAIQPEREAAVFAGADAEVAPGVRMPNPLSLLGGVA